MAGASAETRRVTYVNANYTVGRADGAAFELLVVTEDEERHTLQVPASQMTPLLALTQASGVVLLWDPEGPALIAANLLGEWVAPTWTSYERREPAEGDLR